MQFRDEEEYVGPRDLTEWASRAGSWLAVTAVRVFAWAAPRWVLILTLAVGLGLCAAMTAVAAEIYDAVTDAEGVATLDRPLLDWIAALRTPPVNDAVAAFTALGGKRWLPLLATLTALGLAGWWRRWTPIALTAAAGLGSLLITVLGKTIIGRTRPPMIDAVPPFENSGSFPSGHALNSLVLAGVVVYLLLRRQRSAAARWFTAIAAVMFVVAMGLSRVYLGLHWLTDVLVAWVLGAAWLTAVVTAHRLYLTVVRQRRTAAESGSGA